MKSRVYLFTFILVAFVIIGFGYVGMTLSLDFMQKKYIELQLDINKRQAQYTATFLESQLQKGLSKKEVKENLQTALESSNADKGFLCMFDKYDAEMICHPDENQIGMKLPASMQFENIENGELSKTRNIILEGAERGGLFHTDKKTDIAYMVPVKGTEWMLSAHEDIENIKSEILSQKKVFMIGFAVISLLTAILATVMARIAGRRYEKRIEEQNIQLESTNNELNSINNKLQEKNKEINLQKTIIEDQHKSVKEKNDELKTINEEIRKQKDIIEEQHEFVKKQKEKIEDQNLQIKSSIEYASRIQQALLPPEKLFKEVFNESFVFYRPRDIVSGDFYWLKKVKDTVIYAAADSTGHGVPGAFMSMLGIAFMNEIVNDDTHDCDTCSAAMILNDLRDRIKLSLRQTGESDQTKDGMDMAIIMINTKTYSIQYAGAYNPLYIVRNNKITEVQADKMPVGVYVKDNEPFSNKRAQLRKGDLLYLFSDGYYDQFGEENGRKFMKNKFRELIELISEKPLNEQKQILEATFDDWKGNLEQSDDVLVTGIKI